MGKEIRVRFHGHDGVLLASLWVNASMAGEELTATLQHDYPDFKPQAGWTIEHDGKHFEVQNVDGQVLSCVLAPN